jgi:DNA replication protein DnaD
MTFVDSLSNLEKIVQLTSTLPSKIDLQKLLDDLKSTFEEVSKSVEKLETLSLDKIDLERVDEKSPKTLSPKELEALKKTVLKKVAQTIAGKNTVTNGIKDMANQIEKAVRQVLASDGIQLSNSEIMKIVTDLVQDAENKLGENAKNFFGNVLDGLTSSTHPPQNQK